MGAQRSTRKVSTCYRVLAFVAAISFSFLSMSCSKPDTGKSSSAASPPADKPSAGAATACESVTVRHKAGDKDGPFSTKAEELPVALESIASRKDFFCAIAIPVESTFLGWLRSGERTVEYRRVFTKDRISHIIFYDTKADSLVAVADVTEVLRGNPNEIAELTWQLSGTSFDNVMSYFGDYRVGYVIRLKNFHNLPAPITLSAARKTDPHFSRPFGYLFLERHPKINAAIKRQVMSPENFRPKPDEPRQSAN